MVEFLRARQPKGHERPIRAFWSGGRDSNSRSPGPKPEAKAYRIQLDLNATSKYSRKSLNSWSVIQRKLRVAQCCQKNSLETPYS